MVLYAIYYKTQWRSWVLHNLASYYCFHNHGIQDTADLSTLSSWLDLTLTGTPQAGHQQDGCARHPHSSVQPLASCPQEKNSREQARILIATGLRANSQGWKGGSEAKSSAALPEDWGLNPSTHTATHN